MRLGFCLLLLAALPSAGCTRDRTQVMLGLMTNLYAPGELSKVRLSITRAGVPISDRVWNIPGTLRGDYQLPGSVGLYSEDGGAIEVAASLSAFSPGSDSVPIIQRDAKFTLVPGQTLFTRLALLAAFAAGFLVARRVELLRIGEGLGRVVLTLQHRIFEQVALDFLLHLDGRQLQQLDGLLQLRRQSQMLGEFELECRLHRWDG